MDDDGTNDDQKVGYCQPPKHSQWPKGTSGNPSGKRKRAETILEKMHRILGEDIIVSQSGSKTAMPMDEAMIRTAGQKAISGSIGALKLLLELLGKGDGKMSAIPDYEISDADIAVLSTHADWIHLIEQAKAEQHSNEDVAGESPEQGGENYDGGF